MAWVVLICGLLSGLLWGAGCSQQNPIRSVTAPLDLSQDALVVPGNVPWVDTGIDVVAGQPVTIVARGKVSLTRLGQPAEGSEVEVTPKGTFQYSDAMIDQPFPLAAAGAGPAPCFCLIGRIGFREPFFVGENRSWLPEHSGRLYLGINDFQPAQNQGQFYAEIAQGEDLQAVTYRQHVPLDVPECPPPERGSVVVIYVDGLRPDVLEEMAAMNHVPHLRRHFIEGGTFLANTFTAFPSDTITSNGTMWTGCFSDRHGLKGQVRFSRFRQISDSFLEPLGPARSSRQLGPQGIDKFVHDTEVASVKLAWGEQEGRKYRESKTSSVPAVYEYLRAEGSDWATGVLPIMTDAPPVLWTRSMTRVLPYFEAQNAWQYIDDANAHYAVRHLIRQNRPVTIVWLPETDSVSHKQCRGQFGSTRRTIARADRLVGDIVAELEAAGRLQQTFLILVSDHGHLGGRDTHLARFDVAHELIYQSREVNAAGQWVGGGLGLSVKQHRSVNWHAGDTARQFVFVDGDSDGTARLFFPRRNARDGNWSGPNTAAELLAYKLADHLPPLNLPETFAHARATHDNGQVGYPIDLVLMKLSPHELLITTSDRGQAVIDRRRTPRGTWEYRYTPVHQVGVQPDGTIQYSVISQPRTDPLGIVPVVRNGFLDHYYDEQAWLWMTAMTDYPDGVVTLARHMFWQETIASQEAEFAPDLVITARRGWMFGTYNTPGTTHGYPLRESMRATWYIAGPHVRQGARIETPCRLVDLTPTILELAGVSHDPSRLDGIALRNIFDTQETRPLVREQPQYWHDVDLRAWQPLTYRPAAPHEHLPWTMNHPYSGWDVNNIAYNTLSIGDWSLFRIIDDIVSPLSPARAHVAQRMEHVDQRARHGRKAWVADGADALNVPEVALSDYNLTSMGNLKRADGIVDWLQARSTRLDRRLAEPIGKPTVLGTPHTNRAVDSAQRGFWELYRFTQRITIQVLDEIFLNGLEDRVDNAVNTFRTTPAEVKVP